MAYVMAPQTPRHDEQTPAHDRLALTTTLSLWAAASWELTKAKMAHLEAQMSVPFRRDQHAAMSIGNVGPTVITLVLAVILPIILVGILAAQAPTYFESVANLTAAFKDISTGDAGADAIAAAVGSVFAIIAVVGFLGIAVAVAVIKFRGSSS